jgi:hypothetical protein
MGSTQSKAGTTLLRTQFVHRMPSTDKTRADSVESTSKEPTTASLRHATTKEEAGSRKGQQSSPGNLGLSGTDLEESTTALLAASIARKAVAFANPNRFRRGRLQRPTRRPRGMGCHSLRAPALSLFLPRHLRTTRRARRPRRHERPMGATTVLGRLKSQPQVTGSCFYISLNF